MYLIVGLGNPGAQYAHTRHNVGFDVIEHLSRKLDVSVSRAKEGALIGEVFVDGQKVILAMPQTYMNLSGEAVGPLMRWYRIPPENLMVIYDDIDLPAGHIRIRKSGSAGTHNGMRSIIADLQREDFPRLRVGVGAPREGYDLKNWVLGHYTLEGEREAADAAFERAADAVVEYIRAGIDSAMSLYNTKKEKKAAKEPDAKEQSNE